MRKILFVCTGNTCRSSMAEIIFKDILEREGVGQDFHISSGGTHALEGGGANPTAKKAMEERGLSLDQHRSRGLSRELIDRSDLILTMTLNHKNVVLYLNPEAQGKVFTLKEYVGGSGQGDVDIMDPFGQSLEFYKKSGQEIEENLQKLYLKLVKDWK